MSIRALASAPASFVLSISFAATGLEVSAAAPRTAQVQGGWIEALPCPFTTLAPVAGHPTTVSFSCTAGTIWDGTWTGQTHFVIKGTMDLVSGDGTGTADETFVGSALADHSQGSLHFLGDWTLYGASNSYRGHEVIVDATGQFAGAKGEVTFEGMVAGLLGGHGGYRGWWSRPTTGGLFPRDFRSLHPLDRSTAGFRCAPYNPPARRARWNRLLRRSQTMSEMGKSHTVIMWARVDLLPSNTTSFRGR